MRIDLCAHRQYYYRPLSGQAMNQSSVSEFQSHSHNGGIISDTFALICAPVSIINCTFVNVPNGYGWGCTKTLRDKKKPASQLPIRCIWQSGWKRHKKHTLKRESQIRSAFVRFALSVARVRAGIEAKCSRVSAAPPFGPDTQRALSPAAFILTYVYMQSSSHSLHYCSLIKDE